MSWFSKIRHQTPDGTPLSEWDEMEFDPQPDITAYEIAIILKSFASWSVYNLGMAGPVWTHKDGRDWMGNLAQCRRHFRLAAKETR